MFNRILGEESTGDVIKDVDGTRLARGGGCMEAQSRRRCALHWDVPNNQIDGQEGRTELEDGEREGREKQVSAIQIAREGRGCAQACARE